MKTEEAIKRIKNLIKGREDPRGKTELDFALDMAIEALKEQKPHGKWSGEPERRKMVTRVCTACGERSAVGYYCMWCGAYDGVSPRRDEKEGEAE